jgi:hypothetical protein
MVIGDEMIMEEVREFTWPEAEYCQLYLGISLPSLRRSPDSLSPWWQMVEAMVVEEEEATKKAPAPHDPAPQAMVSLSLTSRLLFRIAAGCGLC